MNNRLEIHQATDTEKPHVELLKKRDIKLLKRALGKQAADSLKARSVRDSLKAQTTPELEKRQLEVARRSLGKLAAEKGITKLPQRYRSRKLARQLDHARKELH